MTNPGVDNCTLHCPLIGHPHMNKYCLPLPQKYNFLHIRLGTWEGSLTWEVMEVDVDEVLIAPGDAELVLLVVRNDVTQPVDLTHAGQIHQHHSRVDTYKRTSLVVTKFPFHTCQP